MIVLSNFSSLMGGFERWHLGLTAIVKTNFTLSHNWPVSMMRAHTFLNKLLVLIGGTLPTDIAL